MASLVSGEQLPLQTPAASRGHMLRMLGLMLGITVAGVWLHASAVAPSEASHRPNVLPFYVSLIAAEWLLFRAVVVGLRPAGLSWRALVGATGKKGLAVDALLGVLVCAGWVAIALARPAESAGSARSLLPQGALESVTWILLCASAGFCEEITFRGYFQAQFEALTYRKGAAMVLQAALFGLVHAYEGPRAVLAIAGYGMALAALARWRGSLRAGMLAHALSDVILGLALFG
jgi:membrane protease YdiL (CAAX protease family)